MNLIKPNSECPSIAYLIDWQIPDPQTFYYEYLKIIDYYIWLFICLHIIKIIKYPYGFNKKNKK